jgi:uncharacterized protein YkwD
MLASLIAAPAAHACSHAGDRAGTAPLGELRKAVVCLVNRERRRHGLDRLASGQRLSEAAARYAGEMRTRDFFSHTSPEGETFVDRIRRAGYMEGREQGPWAVGETLAWAPGDTSQPASLVRALMDSPSHRDVILDPAYRELGAGLVPGTPTRERSGLTLVIDFGSLVRSEAPDEAASDEPRANGARANPHGKRRGDHRQRNE